MRGRKPRRLEVAAEDLPVLREVAAARASPWFQVQHARIVLAVAAGERVGAVASRAQCDPATVWRVCRRYERGGLGGLLADEPRAGRPQEISPLAARPDRAAGLPGAGRPGAARHPLGQRGPGPAGGRRRHRGRDQPPHRPADPGGRGPAAAPHPLLADRPRRRAVQGAGRAGALVLRQCRAAGPRGGRLDGGGGRGAQLPGAGAAPDPAGGPGPRRAAGVRVHPPRHRQPAAVPGRPHRPDGGRGGGAEGRRPLHRANCGRSAAGTGTWRACS